MNLKLKEYAPTADIVTCESFWQRVGVPSRGAELHESLHRGLPFKICENLGAEAGLGTKALAKVAHIAPATLNRRKQAGHFNQDESDRLFRLAEVLNAAQELFEGDREAANLWLAQPVKGLGGRRPIEMLGTSAEVRDVLALIGRLEHGVFA